MKPARIDPQELALFVKNTIAVCQLPPAQRGEWRSVIETFIAPARAEGQLQKVEFFEALIGVIDGGVPVLTGKNPFQPYLDQVLRGLGIDPPPPAPASTLEPEPDYAAAPAPPSEAALQDAVRFVMMLIEADSDQDLTELAGMITPDQYAALEAIVEVQLASADRLRERLEVLR